MENVTRIVSQPIYFRWYDHTFFGIMLFLSSAIGVYFSLTGGKKKDTTDEYFMGGKKMSVLPIAISMVASHISSVSLMSVPVDVYSFGAMYWLSVISIFVSAFATSYIYLPVFYELQLDSTYEYLEIRFNASIRTICSLFFILNIVLFMGIVVYVPALAYSQATGFSIYYIIPLICTICTFYTTIGGLKTVVWTDTLQFTVTAVAVLTIFCLGTNRAGGFGAIFKAATEGGRIIFDFDLDMTKRETVFAVLMHWFLTYTRMLSTSQECVLKFLALPSLKKGQQAIFLFCFGIIAVKSIIVVTGLIMFALYKNCDPLTAGLITKADELLPYYVADVASSIPGLTGLFLSGVFCTALSTLSAIMNALSATIYQDFIAKFMPQDKEDKHTNLIIKLLVVLMGIVITVLALFVQYLGPIMPLAISVASISAGSFLGLFTLGILCPTANTKGAFSGVLVSTVIVGWMFVGAQWYKSKDVLKSIPKHLTTNECPFDVPQVLSNSTISDASVDILYIYRISYYYYAFIGCTVCVIVGLLVSYISKQDKAVDKRLLSPCVHFLVANKGNKYYFTINKANAIVNTINMKEIVATK